MCYICKAEIKDYKHFYGQVKMMILNENISLIMFVVLMVLQGGVATSTQTCPLWSDNKAIHEEALAKAAEEAREKLKQENVTLDIDPLKGIAKPAAKQTKEEVKQGLFTKWYDIKAEVIFQKCFYNLPFHGSLR